MFIESVMEWKEWENIMHLIFALYAIYILYIFIVNKSSRNLTNIILYAIVIGIVTLIHQNINYMKNKKSLMYTFM